MRRYRCSTCALLLFCCATLRAQDFRATISGHVLDSSGAAVPNARIQAISSATGETTNAVSDNSGSYTIPLLRPGVYRVNAAAQGFKQYVKDSIQLDAAKVVGVDINLEIGAVTDTVEVTADAAMLETQTASRGGIVTTQQVAEMPLNARNPFILGAMMSGVTFNGAAILQRPFDNGAIAEWSINGSRNSSTEFFLDGASNNGQMGNNNIAYVPIVDAVQEFQVMQNLYNSEYGHSLALRPLLAQSQTDLRGAVTTGKDIEKLSANLGALIGRSERFRSMRSGSSIAS